MIESFEQKCQTARCAILPSAIFQKYHEDVTRQGPRGRIATILHEKNVLAIGLGSKRHVDDSYRTLRKLSNLSMHALFVLASCEELHRAKVGQRETKVSFLAVTLRRISLTTMHAYKS